MITRHHAKWSLDHTWAPCQWHFVNNYFGSQSLATAPTAFDGRSDYGPFIAVGIPAGGLFSGAEGVTTAEEAAVCGGTAEDGRRMPARKQALSVDQFTNRGSQAAA